MNRPSVRAHALAVLLLAACAGCGGPDEAAPPGIRLDPSRFDAARAFEEVRAFVALGPREATTPGAERAAVYLRDRLGSLGIGAVIDEFTDGTPLGPKTFRNVIGTLPGTTPGLVLLGSHYDTKSGIGPDFQGANDSGSSTGVLLEMARVLAASGWQGPELQFLFFDGEEAQRTYGPHDGLHGSRHYAARLVREGRDRSVRAVIVLDMIGDRDLNVMIPRNSSPALAARVLRAAHAEGVRSSFSLYAYQIGDDHEPFLNAGMPAIDLIDFHYGSAPGRNDYWHTRADTLDKLSADSLGIVGRVVLRVLADLAAEDAPR